MVSLEAGSASACTSVQSALQACWQAVAQLSGKIWALLGGPAADAHARSAANKHVPVDAQQARTLDAAERSELDACLAQLIQTFVAAERVAVAAESLRRRLPGCPDLADALLQAAVADAAPDKRANAGGMLSVDAAADRNRLAAIMHCDWHSVQRTMLRPNMSQTPSPSQSVAAAAPGKQNNSASAVAQQLQDAGVGDEGRSDGARADWGEPLRRETIMLCRRADCGTGHPATEAAHLPHRLYVAQGRQSARAATALVQTCV